MLNFGKLLEKTDKIGVITKNITFLAQLHRLETNNYRLLKL
jgi:hypothetical protein